MQQFEVVLQEQQRDQQLLTVTRDKLGMRMKISKAFQTRYFEVVADDNKPLSKKTPALKQTEGRQLRTEQQSQPVTTEKQ